MLVEQGGAETKPTFLSYGASVCGYAPPLRLLLIKDIKQPERLELSSTCFLLFHSTRRSPRSKRHHEEQRERRRPGPPHPAAKSGLLLRVHTHLQRVRWFIIYCIILYYIMHTYTHTHTDTHTHTCVKCSESTKMSI